MSPRRKTADTDAFSIDPPFPGMFLYIRHGLSQIKQRPGLQSLSFCSHAVAQNKSRIAFGVKFKSNGFPLSVRSKLVCSAGTDDHSRRFLILLIL